MNVQDDPAGREALAALGARTVPVVSRGERWVSGQVLDRVAELLGLPAAGAARLAPGELAARLDEILAAAQRLLARFTPEQLERDVRNRRRSLRALGHHVFRIPEAFLEVARGEVETLAYDALTTPPPASMRGAAELVAYGDAVRRAMREWADGLGGRDVAAPLATYYGEQTVHELLERTTWHCAQHARQLEALLGDYGLTPERPIGAEVYEGLPMPEGVWDD